MQVIEDIYLSNTVYLRPSWPSGFLCSHFLFPMSESLEAPMELEQGPKNQPEKELGQLNRFPQLAVRRGLEFCSFALWLTYCIHSAAFSLAVLRSQVRPPRRSIVNLSRILSASPCSTCSSNPRIVAKHKRRATLTNSKTTFLHSIIALNLSMSFLHS